MTRNPNTTEAQFSSPVSDGGGGPAKPGRRGSESDAGSESRPSQEIQSWLDTVTRLLRVEPDQRIAIREELDSHVRDRVCDLMVTGLTEPEAVRRAIEEFGDAAALARSFKTARQGFIRRHLMHAAMLAIAGSALGLSVLAVTDHNLIPGGLPERAEVYGAAPATGPQSAEPIGIASGEMPFKDVLHAAASAKGLTLLVRWSELEEINADPDKQVRIPLDGLTLDELFVEINSQIIDPHLGPAEYRILEDGVLEVSIRDDFDRRETVLVKYDIGDIVEAERERGTRADAASSMIIDTLQHHISSDDWEDLGGDKISVTAFGDTLFITGPARIHPQVAWMLERMAGEPRGDAEEERSLEERRTRLDAEYKRAREKLMLLTHGMSELATARQRLLSEIERFNPPAKQGDEERQDYDRVREQIAALDVRRQSAEFEMEDVERRVQMLRDLIIELEYVDLRGGQPRPMPSGVDRTEAARALPATRHGARNGVVE